MVPKKIEDVCELSLGDVCDVGAIAKEGKGCDGIVNIVWGIRDVQPGLVCEGGREAVRAARDVHDPPLA